MYVIQYTLPSIRRDSYKFKLVYLGNRKSYESV